MYERHYAMRIREITSSCAVVAVVLAMFGATIPHAAGADIVFPKSRPTGRSFSRPRQLESSTVTPPGFCWWRAGPEGRVDYLLIIRDEQGQIVLPISSPH